MKVAFVFAAALILCVALLGPIQARFEKPKYCVGENGKHYLRGEHYDNKVKGNCIRYTCVRKGKKLKMAKKKVPCAVEPEPSLKANVTALEAKLEALQNSVESILVIMTALQSTSSQLEINMTSNMAAININKEAITTNTEGLSVHDDAISSNTDVISSNQAGISVNKNSCSAVQITADKLKTCLGDVTSKECPISQNGKVAVIDAIIENEDDIEALESLHDNKGCCTPTTIYTPTTPPPTTTTIPTTTPAGVVGDWSSWSDCTATCGNATKTRTRSCQISPCQPFVKEETVKCHLPQCNVTGPIEKCFYEDTKITFHDLGLNRHNQNQKPDWILSDKGRTLNSLLNTRPSAGLTNLGKPSDPVSFSGRVFSTNGDDDVMGMVFGYWNETNFFVVASSREFGPTNWYVGRLHATCGHSCASEKTISDAIWSPQDHPEDITVLATGSTYWQHNEKYNFTICFNPSKLLLNVNVTLEDGVDPILQTGTISAKTNDSEVDDISHQGGFIGVYVDSQADTTWDNLDCHECGLDEFGPTALTEDSVYFIGGGYATSRDTQLYHPTIKNLTCSITPPSLENDFKMHISFYHDNAIYLCGGWNTKSLCVSYHTKMNSWVTHNLTESREDGSSSIVFGNTLYLIGDNEKAISTPLPLTTQPVFTSVSNLNYKGHRQCVIKMDEENLIITGGYLYNFLTSVTQYNIRTQNSMSLPSLQQARRGHGCINVEMDNKKWLIVAGGYNYSYIQTSEMLQLGGASWVSLGDLNFARDGTSMIETERGVLIMGGDSGNGNGLNSVELLEWSTKRWKMSMPSLKHKFYFYGGAVKIPAAMFGCTECNNGGELLSTASNNNMALCKDIKNNTCEKDLFNLCPVGWHLCNPKEFNNRNDDWSYTTPTLTFGQMYCRPNGGSSPFVITKPLNQDDLGNCGHYWSSRPGCDLWEGAQYDDGACNNKDATALCCAPAGKCGNGVVDSVEEECDDGNNNELDDCLNSCAWRTPAQHGLNYCR